MNVLRRLSSALVLALFAVFLVPFGVAPAVAAPASNPSPVYRFYKTDGSHFFTNSEVEKANVQATASASYRYEGVAFYSYPTEQFGTSPVYRFYNFKQGVHFYTINPNEYQTLLTLPASLTFRYEGVAYWANSLPVTDTTPVFRFYKFRQGVHFYTSNAAEAAALRLNAFSTYRDEGTAYNLPTKLTFSGTGNGDTGRFVLPSGLNVFKTTHASTISAVLYIPNEPLEDRQVANDFVSNGSTSTAWGLAEGEYAIDVQAGGSWAITIEQPKASTGIAPSFSGFGETATSLFTLTGRLKTLSYSRAATSTFMYIYLFDVAGNSVELVVVEEGGPTAGGTTFLPSAGTYLLNVITDGEWAMSVQ